MSNNDITLKRKVRTHIQTQLPEFIQADHPIFASFVKAYFQFLESAEVTFSEVNNYLRQESSSVNFVLDENGDQIVLEDSEVKFLVGETVTGQSSNATGKVLVDDVDDGKRLFITSNSKFQVGEIISGNTSNASGTIQTYRPNPISNIQQLINFTNVDSTLFSFLDNFRDAFLEGIVDNLDTTVDKRKLIKNVRDLYLAKGTKKGHELFFRLLLNEQPSILFPNENMLKVSDGKWTTRRLIRVETGGALGSGNIPDLVGQPILGISSQATAIVTSTVSFREGGTTIVEIEIDENTKTGAFEEGEQISGISSVNDLDVTATIRGIVVSVAINNSGQYYSVNQKVNVGTVANSNNAAQVKVQTINTGSIDEFIIDDAGTGYAVGDDLIINNENTNGTGAAAQVSVVGGGIAPESGSTAPSFDTTDDVSQRFDNTNSKFDKEIGEYDMKTSDHITLEEESQIFYGDDYDGTKIVLETGTFADLSVASQATEITDIRLISGGNGYTQLPKLDKTNKYTTAGVRDDASGQVYNTGIITTGGSGAKVLPISRSGLGSIGSFELTNSGINYTSAPTITPFRHAVLKDISGTIQVGDTLITHTGTITGFNADTQLISIDTDETFIEGTLIRTSGSASATIANIDIASGTANTGTESVTAGEFLGSDGIISEDVNRIQDSFYYQDYSYVVKVGESIASWRDSLRSSLHPAGWIVFGEVEIKSRVFAGVQTSTIVPSSFTPELASILKTLFSAVFGRRLGTTDDGTSLRVSAQTGVESHTDLSNATRDLTLKRVHNVVIGSRRTDRGGVFGPRLINLAKYAFSVPPTTTSEETANYPGIIRPIRTLDFESGAYYPIEQFKDVKINEISARSFSGETPDLFSDSGDVKFSNNTETFDGNNHIIIPPSAFKTKINVPVPSEIRFIGFAGFDQNDIKFDTSVRTFDGQATVLGTTSFDEDFFRYDNNSVKFDRDVIA